jgi:uncharacterized membrane protein YccF (DUF307 family)
MRLLSLVSLASLVVASNALFSKRTVANLKNVDVQNQQLQNAYDVSIQILELRNVPIGKLNSIQARFFNPHSTMFEPTAVNGSLHFGYNQEFVGVFQNADQVANSSYAGFYLFENSTSSSPFAEFNLSEQLFLTFPNTTGMDSVNLWPDFAANLTAISSEYEALYEARYRGVTSVNGIEFPYPVWKVVALALGVKLGVSAVLAFLDFCCQPLQGASGWSKFGIFFGNTVWMLFGGLESGLAYNAFGLLLMLTIVFLPFGVKLIRIGTFALFPFGREVRTDYESSTAECCSFIGNVLWLLFFGLGMVIVHVVLGIVLVLLLVTIPLGLQHFKLARIAFMPFGHSVVFTNHLHGHYGERMPLHHSVQANRYV